MSEQCLAARGGPFSPHLTLARIRKGNGRLDRSWLRAGVGSTGDDQGPADQDARHDESQLRQAGPVYSKLWECPLAASAA